MDRYEEALERAKAGKPMDEVFPELKESEDERIRKAIESIIRVYGKTQGEWIAGYDMDTLVVHLRNAFLEKQKPNIELIQRSWYMEGYHDREFGREPKWVIKTGKGGPKYEKNEKYGQPLEQKPIKVYDNMDDLIADAMIKEISESDMLDSAKHNRIYWIKKHRQKPTNSEKPKEWSLTDATFIEEIDETLFMAETGRNEVVKNQIERERNFLKSLPERFNLQPKAGWSEEDDIIIDGIIANLEYLLCNTVLVQSTKENIEARLRWMKRLKSLRPQPHWKPSEEQMCELNWASKLSPVLESLYNDLKKLM